MAATEDGAAADVKPEFVTKKLPEVKAETIADEESFECPQPWLLAVLTVAMSFMTSITVVGALFFLLAAPEKVSPHCYAHEDIITRGFCTASTLAFWTYPVVCCLFVVLLYAKNLVDQRTYYEFLLHKVVVGYGRVQAWKQPVVLFLLCYALLAFSALGWYHYMQTEVVVTHFYSALAYIAPIISFLAVIFTQWSIQGKLITLPNFLSDYDWALSHLNKSRCYTVDDLYVGYLCMEHDLDLSDETFETARMIALVEHYAHKVQHKKKAPADIEANTATEESDESGTIALLDGQNESFVNKEKAVISEEDKKLVDKVLAAKEYVYWEVRMLFNPRLQDERSQSFRNWALAYMVSVVFAILLSVYIFVCCAVTCLEIERVLTPGDPVWMFTHYFSLRPDLDHAGHKSLKQMAASVVMSAMQTGTRSLLGRAPTPSHFTLMAAA